MGAGVILLAGGKSRRMGTNKAFLPVGEQTNIERIIAELEPISSQPTIVTNEPEEYAWLRLPLMSDEHPGKGPLAGIQAGLKASACETNLVVACDMPFVSLTVAQALIRESNGYAACVPEIKGKLHPLFAVYTRKCLPVLDDCLQQDRLRVIDLLNQMKVRYIREDDLPRIDHLDKAFFNMNYPNEYERVKKWLTHSES